MNLRLLDEKQHPRISLFPYNVGDTIYIVGPTEICNKHEPDWSPVLFSQRTMYKYKILKLRYDTMQIGGAILNKSWIKYDPRLETSIYMEAH